MCSICCHLHSIFNLWLLLSFYFCKSGIKMQDRKGQWYQHLLTLFAIFDESNTEGTTFWSMFDVYVMCMFCKGPQVTRCGWQGYTLSINNSTLCKIFCICFRHSFTPTITLVLHFYSCWLDLEMKDLPATSKCSRTTLDIKQQHPTHLLPGDCMGVLLTM